MKIKISEDLYDRILAVQCIEWILEQFEIDE